MNRIALLLVPFLTLFSFLHRGRTDAWGGHYDNSSGEYHYHHGMPAHEHYDIDGDGVIDCPYSFRGNSGESEKTNNTSESKHNLKEIISLIVFSPLIYYSVCAVICAFLASCGATDYIERLAKRITKKDLSESALDRFWKIVFVVIGVIGIVIMVCIFCACLS